MCMIFMVFQFIHPFIWNTIVFIFSNLNFAQETLVRKALRANFCLVKPFTGLLNKLAHCWCLFVWLHSEGYRLNGRELGILSRYFEIEPCYFDRKYWVNHNNWNPLPVLAYPSFKTSDSPTGNAWGNDGIKWLH